MSFLEGLAIIRINGKCGYIDKSGNEVIPCLYDSASGFQSFNEGFTWVYK